MIAEEWWHKHYSMRNMESYLRQQKEFGLLHDEAQIDPNVIDPNLEHHYYMSVHLDNKTTPSSARGTRLFRIKHWIWNHIIDTKLGWYWFVDDLQCDIDFRQEHDHLRGREL